MQGGSYIKTEKGLERVQFTAEPKAAEAVAEGVSSSPTVEADERPASTNPAGATGKKSTKGA
ncbi:hypothetical protein SAMN05892877_1095 [Rhizobium subbaraonis]|uniref:Uncharacterized protein n=1 Tax=Rhizobium subbaraonis TaxID=908946 RepID=A0A285UIC6_9HYPH|nr:hypothetical protein [Rhizobium subbaraonis]SOC41562.1 hypothetical protein SAMN05892877_1095 [Rhizobium subbaraonis]